MFPPQGYKILKPPDAYVPIRTPARKLMATPTPGPGQTPLYGLPQEQRNLQQDVPATPAGLPFVKPEDYQYFAPLLKEDDEFEDISPEEVRPGLGLGLAIPAPIPTPNPTPTPTPTPNLTLNPPHQARERKIMKLLLKVKNGTPPMRKQALRQITDKARARRPSP